jgi:hypothetical protein
MERLRARPSGEATCPFCHDGFAEGEAVVACGGCATCYHRECLHEELRGCATLGCSVRPEVAGAFTWGERPPGRAGGGLTCCGERRAGKLHTCAGCGGVLHARCLAARNWTCCPGKSVPVLLDPAAQRDDAALPGRLARGVAIVLLVGAAAASLRLGEASDAERAAWALVLGPIFLLEVVLLGYWERARRRYLRGPAARSQDA